MKIIILILISASALTFAYEEEFNTASSVLVCSIPLPITRSVDVNRLMLGTKHVYLKIAKKTYGMPYTTKRSYFGGDAYFYNGDHFYLQYGNEGETCYSVMKKATWSKEEFLRRISCISEKFSDARIYNETPKEWLPIFDYHALKNNCTSIVDFALKCADGKLNRKFNYSVGDKVGEEKPAKILNLATNTSVPSTYGEICELAKRECEVEENLSYHF